jgi:SAM-dependent methyltransferase
MDARAGRAGIVTALGVKLAVVRLVYWIKGLFQDPVELFRDLGVQNDDRILEIGCALGYHTLALARVASNGKIYAVDVWEQGLVYLEKSAGSDGQIETICRAAEAVEFPRGSLDKIVCFDTLHEVPGFEEAVERWAAFLRAGGAFFYRDPTIPPDRVPQLSRGLLHYTSVIEGIHVFIRR